MATATLRRNPAYFARATGVPRNIALPFPLYAHVNFRLLGGPYAGFLGQPYDPLWTSFDAKGTREVLSGIVPSLVEDGWLFSQDYHIKAVKRLLHDPSTWEPYGQGVPNITFLGHSLASIRFPSTADSAKQNQAA